MSAKHQAQTSVQQNLTLLNLRKKVARYLTNVGLLIFSTLFALLLCEIVLQLLGWKPMYVSPERDRFWKYDSLLGWAHQAGQEGIFETPQFRTSVRINQNGLRGHDYPYKRVNDVGRILVIGDSFAWGYGVEESERFSELLEASLGVEVINAGISGYSTDQELLWFQEEGVKYNADLVILIFTGNDIGDNERQLIHTIYNKPRFVREDEQLILKGYPVPKAGPKAKLIYFLSQHSALAYFLVRNYFELLSYRNVVVKADAADSFISGTNSTREPFELTVALLDEIRKTANSKGAQFMIVATDAWWNSPAEESYSDFIDTLETNGFLVLDVEAMAGFDPAKMHIPDDGHWSSTGHQFVAEKIKDFMESNELIVGR
jgi:lysophospholipase L1-like esterase